MKEQVLVRKGKGHKGRRPSGRTLCFTAFQHIVMLGNRFNAIVLFYTNNKK